MNNLPFVEKYRPTKLSDVILEHTNNVIFKNIINYNYFPNILFYGPPGTGKTTTIINLIKEFQTKNNNNNMLNINNNNVIHLNASDDRGIDIIRNNIYQFVNTNNIFNNDNEIKFVVLDEVDYMTKIAQYALKSLIQNTNKNVKYCLICNYISKIDDGLKNEFIVFRFNQLPKLEVINYINNIVNKENINISKNEILNLQNNYRYDVRSMINYIQLNKNNSINNNFLILNDEIFNLIHSFFTNNIDESIKFMNKLNEISLIYNNDIKFIILNYFNNRIFNNNEFLNKSINYIHKYIDIIKNFYHLNNPNNIAILNLYFSLKNLINN